MQHTPPKPGKSSSATIDVFHVSDLHAGSSVAICPPHGIALEDGGRYMPSDPQKWAYARWLELIEIMRASRRAGHHVVLNFGGEFIDNNHHEITQLAALTPVDMRIVAIELMQPLVALAHEFYVEKGTDAHSGKGGEHDRVCARELGARSNPFTGQPVFSELDLDLGGVIFNFAHHISGAGNNKTAGNNIRNELIEMMLDNPAINVVLRGHVHTYADTGHNYMPARWGGVTPSWKLRDDFISRISRARRLRATVGAIQVTVQSGAFFPRPLLWQAPTAPLMTGRIQSSKRRNSPVSLRSAT